tara:strand:- start:187 stop:540 length:354 start_codon:yes stop_codon:yes gene_type:complete
MKIIDYKGLTDFLKTLKYEDFSKNEVIKIGNSISDIEHFKKDKANISLDSLINYGDYFLVDALGNDLSVCKSARKKYTLPNGRVVSMKHEGILIEDCRKQYGSPINGYWVIPEQFIT